MKYALLSLDVVLLVWVGFLILEFRRWIKDLRISELKELRGLLNNFIIDWEGILSEILNNVNIAENLCNGILRKEWETRRILSNRIEHVYKSLLRDENEERGQEEITRKIKEIFKGYQTGSDSTVEPPDGHKRDSLKGDIVESGRKEDYGQSGLTFRSHPPTRKTPRITKWKPTEIIPRKK